MELPDCPPGTEGYEDSITEIPKKPDTDESCTKAEQEFQEHLNSLKITLEDGEVLSMVQRHGRDNSGKWIYKCVPCAAVCSGENILQTHISGRKHKNKISLRSVWPKSILEEQPVSNQIKSGEPDIISQNSSEDAESPNDKQTCDLDAKFSKYKEITCHIQGALDALKTSLVGVEYLIEHPPERSHYEPTYLCTLCNKQGHPRTIINHMTCFWHNMNYIKRHFPKAELLLMPFRGHSKYREGTLIVMNRLKQRIEDTYGRMRPLHVDKDEYEKNKEQITQWIFKSKHFSEKDGCTFEEIIDVNLIDSLYTSSATSQENTDKSEDRRDPSPPVVAAPTKPLFNSFTVSLPRPVEQPERVSDEPTTSDDPQSLAPGDEVKLSPALVHPKTRTRRRGERVRRRRPPLSERKNLLSNSVATTTSNSKPDEPQSTNRQERRAVSMESLSDISDIIEEQKKEPSPHRTKYDPNYNSRYEPYPVKKKIYSYRSRYSLKNEPDIDKKNTKLGYKYQLADEKRTILVESAKKTLAYHEKNPEKHPLYPDEWKKFWNKRYKEIQAEGKDPSKHDFKPEWIVYWTKRMKELHDDEMRIQVNEMYRKLCISPTEMAKRTAEKRRSSEVKRRSPEAKLRSMEPKRRSPEIKHRSTELRRWSPSHKRRSPIWQRSTDRRRSPEPRREYRRELRRTGDYLRSPNFRRSPVPRHSASGQNRMRSRSPREWRRSPSDRARSTRHLEHSGSPLSRRDAALHLRNRSPEIAPSMQTVLVSDDDLEPSDIGSSNSVMDDRSRAGSEMSRGSRCNVRRGGSPELWPDPQDMGPAENVVATLRLLVALEDYLGSLGPKIVDLLTDALRMEKEKANSSEKLLERESAVVLMETAKEKLKGAVQAGLVSGSAAVAAVRAAVVRAAATLHEADSRARRASTAAAQGPSTSNSKVPVPVAGIGEVDRTQIAQQMAEALIAQGKTDVTSEELAQLVDAVVGMAEAKKLETQKNKTASRSLIEHKLAPSKMSSTASALQLLQSAYDENEKKMEKADASDMMDGLSNSDLETLLKNFNELSAEEQHSLIAYLKKLEAREPQRVERLRQYVSAVAPNAAPILHELPPKADSSSVIIQSDDDEDYTVDEVFQSATQKVKEDQIRQEMEIVKKSLEESKSTQAIESHENNPVMEIARNISSASDLLALVQASIQSTARPPPPVASTADVVTSNIQPRSFGDSYEPPVLTHEPIKPVLQNHIHPDLSTPPPQNIFNHQTSGPQMGLLRTPLQNRINYSGNRNLPNPNYNQGSWNQQPMNTMQHVRPASVRPTFDSYSHQPQYNNQGPQGNFMNGRQDNFEARPPEVNQQYGGYQGQQNNFRGRGVGGRGNYGGGMKRGRGRGGYYQ